MAKMTPFTVEVKVTPNDDSDGAATTSPATSKIEVSKSGELGDVRSWVVCKNDGADPSKHEKRQIMCVAMVADEVDAHGDSFTPEAVEGAANEFVARWNIEKDIGRQHTDELPDVDLIGSWYTEQGGQFDELTVPKHSWVVKMRINDDPTWDDAKSGKLTGVSIQGPAMGYEVSKSVDSADASADSDEKNDPSEGPKRIFVEANPYRVDLVDSGANLKVLVWKSKAGKQSNDPVQEITNMAEKIQTEPAPAKDTAAELEKNTDNAKPAEKAELVQTEALAKKSDDSKPAGEDVAKAKVVTPKRKAKFRDLARQFAELATELGADDEDGDEDADSDGATEQQVSKSEGIPVEALKEILAPLAKSLGTIGERLETLEGARSASSVSEDESSKSPPKRAAGPFGGVFDGVFSKG